MMEPEQLMMDSNYDDDDDDDDKGGGVEFVIFRADGDGDGWTF